jgi:outer membrane protein TolC
MGANLKPGSRETPLMSLPGIRLFRFGFLLLCAVPGGCAILPSSQSTPTDIQAVRATSSPLPTTPEEIPSRAVVRRVSFTPRAIDQSSTTESTLKPAVAATTVLTVESLVQQVLARNPSLAQMTTAWQAASARYPQVTSLEDPMLGTKLGPGSIGSDTVGFAYMVEVSQKLPFPGKRGLRGQTAQAEADAAGRDVEDMRLQLIENAQAGFYDYYLVERGLEVNAENLKFLQEFRQTAAARYEKGLVPLQDLRQADVEIGREQERRLTLEETQKITQARINTLLHLPPDSPLPPPPRTITLQEELPEVAVLRSSALTRRPDLQAHADRIRAEQASLALAQKEFCPDFEVSAGYDAFWQEKPLRSQVGLRLNLPIYKGRRNAAVAEAQARIAQREAELARQTDQVNLQVQEAYERVVKSEKTVRLYVKTILPAAKSHVEAARSAYEKGSIPSLSLIEAQRNQVGLRDRYYEALADYFRRRAALERAIGGPFGDVIRPNSSEIAPGPPRLTN